MNKDFNLVSDPWIPVANLGLVSLKDIFTRNDVSTLGGTPIEKIAVLKLLLAVAQAACTPEDDQEWKAMGAEGLAQRCLNYLENWKERFFLYGEAPFLQMPSIFMAEQKPYGALKAEIASGNTTVVSSGQIEQKLSDAEKALLLLTQMGFAFAGKKVDNEVVLSNGYQGKTKPNGKAKSGKYGPSLGFMGMLHNFVLSPSLKETIWLNVYTVQRLELFNRFSSGLGTPPWEQMPEGEACDVATQLQNSYMGRLIPLSRFCLLTEEGVHYTQGLDHLGHKDGNYDPSIAASFAGKDPKVLWARPDKKPWREITSLLSFIEATNSSGFLCEQLEMAINRLSGRVPEFGIWSGGVKVSSNAGEQYLTGNDDFVESTFWIDSNSIGSTFFLNLSNEISGLSFVGKHLYGRVIGYFKKLNKDGGKQAEIATQLFWQYCERDFQGLLHHLTSSDEDQAFRSDQRKRFAGYANKSFNVMCGQDTARQLDAWAANKPSLSKYIFNEVK